MTARENREASVCPFDHHDPTHREEGLYATYAVMRSRGITWSPHHGGFWMVTSYACVRAALRDHLTFSSAGGCFLPDLGYRNLALEQDPPKHGLFRDIFVSAVGRNAVAGYVEQIREMVERIVGEFVAAGGGDARAEISEKVPVEGICLMLGLSPTTAARVRELTVTAWRVLYTNPDPLAPIREMLMAEAAERVAHPRGDFLTTLTTIEVDGRRLREDEIGNLLQGAVIAGHETTMNASSNLIYELACDPELQRRLRERPDEIPHVVEECLRHRAPIHVFFRTVTAETQLGGIRMQPGDKVALVFAAANRDPDRFPDPDSFRPQRQDVAHVSFGWGIHRCVGSFLAQTELRLIARALLDGGDLILHDVEMAPLTGGIHMGMQRVDLRVVRHPAAAPAPA